MNGAGAGSHGVESGAELGGVASTENARRALEVLRDTSHFQWSVVPLLLVVIYVYGVEVERRNWSVVLAGLALWGMDWFNEVWNGLILHFSNHAPFWATPSGSAYVILIGLNVEISLMFAVMGVASVTANALTWDWHYWNAWFPWPIFLIGYLPFFVVAFWVHDMGNLKRQATTVGAILGVDTILVAAFLSLGWI